MTLDTSKEKLSSKASGMKRRTGTLPERERVTQVLREAMTNSASLEEFHSFLTTQNFEFYTRGKHFGVKVTNLEGKQKNYRFATLGVHEAFEHFQNNIVEQQAEGTTQKHETASETSQTAESFEQHKTKDQKPKQEKFSPEAETKNPKQTREEKIAKTKKEFDDLTRQKNSGQTSGQKPKP